MNKIKQIVSFFLMVVLVITALPVETLAADEKIANASSYTFRVLELAPLDSDYVLSQASMPTNTKLYQYSVKEYNAIREDLIGRYDLIVISNGAGASAERYATLGGPVNKLPAGNKANGSKLDNYDKTYPVYEYWPGNDATDLLIGKIKAFAQAGHVVIADSKLKSYPAANAKIHKFVQENTALVKSVTKNSLVKTVTDLLSVNAYKSQGILRPYLNVVNGPKDFDGSNASYIDTSKGVILKFEYDAMGYTEATNFDVNLYFDINGDNRFEAADYELLKTKTSVGANTNLSFSINIPEDFKGLMPYKFELTDKTTGAKNYKIGYLAFRGDEPIRVNVLQVACNGNTFNLATDLRDEAGNNLLTAFAKDYIIDVDVITMDEYTNLYANPSFKLTEYVGPGNDKPYNMLIFGFADIYGGADITSKKIADDLKNFINTGQSVMFTHDNLTFRVDESGGWSRGLTKYFRDFVGQNIYSAGNYPRPGYVTLGFSDMAFERAETGGFTTTSKVYALNDGIMTNYPFRTVGGTTNELYDVSYNNRLLTVATTHYQYYQLDLNNEDVVVWYTLTGGNNDYRDPANYYYTYSIGNVTYSGTGHSNLNAANSFAERRLFVNTIIKAIRGANFAPEVEVQGVSTGDKIARSTDKMTFNIIARDPDISDQYLGGSLYLDKNGDGIYSVSEKVLTFDANNHTNDITGALISGQPKEVTIDLSSLSKDIAEFGFKIIVADTQGATATKEARFPLVDSPTMQLNLSGPDGMLLGDKAVITASPSLNVPTKSIETKISNIKLQSGIADKNSPASPLSMAGGPGYSITNYSGDYSLSAPYLKKSLSEVVAPVPGTTGLSLGSYHYTIQATNSGDYILSSSLSYDLVQYGFAEEKKTSKNFTVRKGEITYSLVDDFGAPVAKNLDAEIYYYKNLADLGDLNNPDLSKGTKLKDLTTDKDDLVYGDEPDEVLATGYYVLVTKQAEGYGEVKTKGVYVDYNNALQLVDVEVPSQPVSKPTWQHVGATKTGVVKTIEEGQVVKSTLTFETYREFVDFTLAYTQNHADYMNMVLESAKVVKADGTSLTVTANFVLDQSGLTIGWKESVGTMPEGAYTLTFTHGFKATAPAASYTEYVLDPAVKVVVKDKDNNNINATYSYPEVLSEALRFLKNITIL